MMRHVHFFCRSSQQIRFGDSHGVDRFVIYVCLDAQTDRHDEACRSAQQIRLEDSHDVDRFVTYVCLDTQTDRHDEACRSAQHTKV